MDLEQAEGIGADTEERPVSETRQSGISQKQIETEAVDHPDRDLQLRDTGRGRPARSRSGSSMPGATNQERPSRGGTTVLRRRGGQPSFRPPVLLFLPKSPLRPEALSPQSGADTSTAATIRWRRLRLFPTASPTMMPPTTAPQKLPTPPRTMIRNAGMTASIPDMGPAAPRSASRRCPRNPRARHRRRTPAGAIA